MPVSIRIIWTKAIYLVPGPTIIIVSRTQTSRTEKSMIKNIRAKTSWTKTGRTKTSRTKTARLRQTTLSTEGLRPEGLRPEGLWPTGLITSGLKPGDHLFVGSGSPHRPRGKEIGTSRVPNNLGTMPSRTMTNRGRTSRTKGSACHLVRLLNVIL